MRRTELLQEIRKMRFEEAYEGWEDGRLTQAESASLLGVCERTFRRYLNRYEEEGLQGLIDRRLEQVSHRRAPVDEVMQVTERYRARHMGWNAKHFYAWYRRMVESTATPGSRASARGRIDTEVLWTRQASQAAGTRCLAGADDTSGWQHA